MRLLWRLSPPSPRPLAMRVLGIESSCDETAAAVVDTEGNVLSDVVASQIAEHAPYGGVVPELAARAHLRAVVPVVTQAVDDAGGWEAIDAVAVTHGPGLVGALVVGVQVAQAIAWSRDLPLVGVNHLDGHLLAAHLRYDSEETFSAPAFPYIALLASGGHTALYRVDAHDSISLIGQTRDDAAGEAFDKAAKVLGLGYPGGPVIDRLAAKGDPKAITFPVPMASKRTSDFSFSGLKTAVARYVQQHGPVEDDALPDVCASFQRSITRVLARKAVLACEAEEVPRLVLAGGVAANRGLRRIAGELASKAKVELFVPALRACTDNAAMIAYAGALKLATGARDEELAIYSRDPQRRRGKFRRDGTLVKRK
ncbi:MAG: tRNA (adenosine(37)-N6)-threonylcarbamoyltransferase complex transferase subunit TsaD [Myxococcota bacterium]